MAYYIGEKCIKCGQCIKACHFNVIERKVGVRNVENKNDYQQP